MARGVVGAEGRVTGCWGGWTGRGTGRGWDWRAWHKVWRGLEGVARGVGGAGQGVARGVGGAGQGVAQGVEGAGACGNGRGVGWRAWHKVQTGQEGVAQGVVGAGGRGTGCG